MKKIIVTGAALSAITFVAYSFLKYTPKYQHDYGKL
ncbi:hypothetical protein I580_01109 [Enterococcus caccae ATCC BAA-1240]|uniref:Uncharacterized protein n=1 Tax=Enterococcus caccae ATCC BAA-1240 TaxID=1158612 RepID=R3TSM2_9ENTE|nr:hypothetical protein UC7_02202 [Enterococcus caccae ATCC BAA-1240]EOT68726.1 hypothetical protein I580_01109 [Enterococcus caccae ATCC BAA-1240]